MSKKLPFWIYPAHWGLKGQALAIAKIDFEFDGLEADLLKAEILFVTDHGREEAKNEILYKAGKKTEAEYLIDGYENDFNHKRLSEVEYKTKVLQVQFDKHLISEKSMEEQLIEILPEGEEKVRAALDYAYKYHLITQNEYDKESSTLDGEPWFAFDVEYDEESNDVVLSFDYNEIFWKTLQRDGHPGTTEDEIIDNFIKDWGRKLATEEYGDNYDTKLTTVNDQNQTGTSDGLKIYE